MNKRTDLAIEALSRALGHETAHLCAHEQIEVLAHIGRECFDCIATIATDDLIEPVANDATSGSAMSCPHCDGVTPFGVLLHTPGCPNEALERHG